MTLTFGPKKEHDTLMALLGANRLSLILVDGLGIKFYVALLGAHRLSLILVAGFGFKFYVVLLGAHGLSSMQMPSPRGFTLCSANLAK